MITDKKQLRYYLQEDDKAVCAHTTGLVRFFSLRRRFYHRLRKAEYFRNCRKDLLGKIAALYYIWRYRSIGRKLCWDIPMNCLGAGTEIAHQGTVVINGQAKIGDHCKIHVCVNIGANRGSKNAPQIGNHVYIAPGAKIFGDIRIADNVVIGANAVVNKSFEQPGVTIAGVPAKVIAERGFDFN